MSQSGRGFGRAARGQDPKKSSSYSGSGKSSSVSSGKSSGRVKPSTSRVGESRAGFPQQSSEIRGIITKTAVIKLEERGGGGEGTSSTPIGRGGIRGRRPIAVIEILRTKPPSCISKQGTYGNRIHLLTNYFNLETVTDWVLYQYRVDFNVEEDRESVLRSWLRQHKDRLNTTYIFDGTMMFTSQRLTSENQPLVLTSIRESDGAPVEIQIRLIQALTYGNAVYLQVFNILVRRCLLHLNLQLVNRNHFDPKASIRLPQHFLEIWPGYITSIRQHEKNILLCGEITHKVMRTDTALKVLSECITECRGTDYKRIYLQAMIGTTVLTDYNNKTYRIDDVDYSQNPMSTFKYKNNEVITYVQYYQQRYQIKIRDMKQPLLISRATPKELRAGLESQCLLIPELCRMTGLSPKMLENKNLMKDLSEITRIAPHIRIERLKTFNKRLQNEPKVVEDFKQWGMTLSRNLLSVPGRELPPEKLLAGNSVTYSTGLEVDWTRHMRSSPMLSFGRFYSFVVICAERIRRDVEDFLHILQKASEGMNFRLPKPIIIEMKTDGPADLIDGTEIALSEHHPDLILYGFTSDRGDRYNAVKKKCFVDRGVPCQVILLRSMKSRGVLTIATKLAVQINCKVGGIPWTVNIPAEHVMVIGFDVCHDKAGPKTKSVGAFVASLNKTMSSWYSTITFHSGGEELSNSLAADLSNALQKYRENNNNILPSRIFFYRDGVGEGQLQHVYHHEVDALKKQLTETYGGEKWKLAFIVVTKRINTRFFDNGKNPRPGTIVDDVVTLPEKYDFFLVSQSVRQGTVSPTCYNVISDNLDWAPDHIQRFTYKMTHMYFNCSTSVRVPAACQYAHKLAFMVSQNLHGVPNSNLCSKLYFL